jgi:lysophospholipase L1-like esterase
VLSRKVLAVNIRGWIENAARRIGPAEIALIIMATLTMILVAFTLFHTPSPPVSAALPMATQTTTQISPAPSASATASPTATAGPQVVAFLGDSYAFGTGASTQSKRWADLVSLKQGWVEKNLSDNTTSYSTAGAPGGTSYQAQLGAVVATGAQIVVVSGGRNDVGVAATQFSADVRATFAGIHAGLPRARIIVVSPTWGNDPAPQRLTDLISIVKAEAERAGATYLDIGEPMFGQSSMVGADGWHPNDAGYAAIAAAVDRALV